MHVLLPLLLDLISQHFSITHPHYHHKGVFFTTIARGLGSPPLHPYQCLILLFLIKELFSLTVALSVKPFKMRDQRYSKNVNHIQLVIYELSQDKALLINTCGHSFLVSCGGHKAANNDYCVHVSNVK